MHEDERREDTLPSVPGYQITMHTARRCGSGTRARVYVELVGDGGGSEVLALVPRTDGLHGSAGFRAGSSITFTFPDLACVGELRCARVSTDGSGCFPAWKLR